MANSITVTGGINSNGNAGSADANAAGEGGGGSGGSIKLMGKTLALGSSLVTASGGAGGALGGGGGGAGGAGRVAVFFTHPPPQNAPTGDTDRSDRRPLGSLEPVHRWDELPDARGRRPRLERAQLEPQRQRYR